MKVEHTHTVDRILRLEIGFASDMAPALLSDVIIEALLAPFNEHSVIKQARIVYIKSSAPGVPLTAVDIFAHVPEPEDDREPPALPSPDTEDPEANL